MPLPPPWLRTTLDLPTVRAMGKRGPDPLWPNKLGVVFSYLWILEYLHTRPGPKHTDPEPSVILFSQPDWNAFELSQVPTRYDLQASRVLKSHKPPKTVVSDKSDHGSLPDRFDSQLPWHSKTTSTWSTRAKGKHPSHTQRRPCSAATEEVRRRVSIRLTFEMAVMALWQNVSIVVQWSIRENC